MGRRPSEIITSLREKCELAKEAKLTQKTAMRGVDANARYCPAGHCFCRTNLVRRQKSLQVAQSLEFPPPVVCDGCSSEIEEEYIAGTCKTCDMDFCETCFQSGRPIEEMVQENLEYEFYNSGSRADIMALDPTKSNCAAGHQLVRVGLMLRRRQLQEKIGLENPPRIECDCCSKLITTDYIAGCCMECDIDFCEDCFQKGQSFEDMLDPGTLVEEEEEEPLPDRPLTGQRYNRRRPTYEGAGRVSYDDFPDPTAFRWSFTGSCESDCVEFFEKDFAKIGIVKLDFYYVEGTLRTVLEHPRKGDQELFSRKKQLKPKTYRHILRDPRKCTDKRLRKKKDRERRRNSKSLVQELGQEIYDTIGNGVEQLTGFKL